MIPGRQEGIAEHERLRNAWLGAAFAAERDASLQVIRAHPGDKRPEGDQPEFGHSVGMDSGFRPGAR